MTSATEITRLLKEWASGDRESLDRLMPLVYERLSEIAHVHLAGERPGHTLDTRGLVHEAYLKLVDVAEVEWRDRVHFLSMASRLMRRILVDHARKRTAQKRGGSRRRVELKEDLLLTGTRAETLIELDEALGRLETLNARQAAAVEHHYFGGLTAEETAAALEVSRATVERDLRAARAWLAREWGAPA